LIHLHIFPNNSQKSFIKYLDLKSYKNTIEEE
jgi:hypothetical protein